MKVQGDSASYPPSPRSWVFVSPLHVFVQLDGGTLVFLSLGFLSVAGGEGRGER